MAGHRSNSQPQLHHDMDGQPVAGVSWDAPQRQASGGGGAAGSGRAGSAGAGGSRLAHSASTGNAAFDGFEGAAPEPRVSGWRCRRLCASCCAWFPVLGRLMIIATFS